ncbi:hypothetical protein [Streptomyces sp. PvR034]|uniref:hypothetical protein n=1 Tax=Streptomyces sp. PvR034 TaxID=3156401 RepID=UPI00339A85FF
MLGGLNGEGDCGVYGVCAVNPLGDAVTAAGVRRPACSQLLNEYGDLCELPGGLFELVLRGLAQARFDLAEWDRNESAWLERILQDQARVEQSLGGWLSVIGDLSPFGDLPIHAHFGFGQP